MGTNSILARLAILISANTAAFGQALKNSTAQLKSFQNTVKGIGASIGVSLGSLALFQGLKAGIGIISDFEHTMQTLKAISGATGEEFRSLEREALRLGAATEFTSKEVGQLQIAYSRLGFNTTEIHAATEATLDLAAATGEDLAKAADVAGSTVRGFGLNAKETQRVVDVMAKSFNTTALGLDNFTEAMKYVAPIAAAANVSMEETTALLGVLADAGIRGSSAGTALRKIFGELSKDGRPFAERLAELSKKGLTLSDSFDEVGRTAQTALLVITKNKDKADQLTKSFGDVAGEAARVARIMRDDLQGDVEKLSSAFEGLILNLTNSDVFRNFVQQLTEFVNVVQGQGASLDRTFKEIIHTLTQSGDLNLFSDKDVNANLDQYVERLKEIRREQGKPFDLRIVEELATKYNLTSRAAGFLRSSLQEANGALSFQETVIKNFKNSKLAETYGETKEAIDKYIESLNAAIIADTNRQQQLKQTDISFGTSAFTEQINKLEERIQSGIRQIAILKQFAAGITEADKKVISSQEKVIISLGTYQDTLKGLNDEYKKTDARDTSRLRILSAQISGVELLIKRLEHLKSIGDLELRIAVPDLSALLDPKDFDVSGLRSWDSGEGIFGSLLSEDMVQRFKDRLAETQAAFSGTVETIKTEFSGIDLRPLLNSALVGIGEAIGNAMAGTEKIGKLLFKVFGGILSQFGQMLITAGVGIVILKKAFQSLNGYAAIAAGVALVALGAAVGASTRSLGNSMGGGGGGSSTTRSTASQLTSQAGESIPFNVKFRIEGTDLVGVLNTQEKRNGRLSG